MKMILKGFIYIIFFIALFIVFTPKENLYFYALDYLKQYKVEANHSDFKDNYIGFGIDDIKVSYDNIEVSDISKVDFKTYLFKTDLNIKDIEVDKSFTKFMPHGIKYATITHSIMDPLNIHINSKFTMGTCSGVVDLLNRVVILKLDVSKQFKSKYKMLVRNLKKSKEKGNIYVYEYKF